LVTCPLAFMLLNVVGRMHSNPTRHLTLDKALEGQF
ncbi:MAG: hypothetical protein ACI8ZM_005652, partial [Crocinitomix sp.]